MAKIRADPRPRPCLGEKWRLGDGLALQHGGAVETSAATLALHGA